MKNRFMKKIVFLAAVLAFLLIFSVPEMVLAKETGKSDVKTEAAEKKITKKLGANSSLELKRTADIVFLIDTTGSMRSAIENVRKNLDTFIDKLDDEGINARVRFVSFRDGGSESFNRAHRNMVVTNSSLETLNYFKHEDIITCPYEYTETTDSNGKIESWEYSYDADDWYTKETVAEAEKALTEGPFGVLYGGAYGECPMTAMAEITKDGYFDRPQNENKTVAKFCILITDEPYDSGTYYKNPCGTEFGKEGLTKEQVIEELRKKGIHFSVLTQTGLYDTYKDFLTEPTTLDSDKYDGGMMDDIYGNYDIFFEKLSKVIPEIVDDKLPDMPDDALRTTTIKVRANMIVLRKQKNANTKYYCVEGECTSPYAIIASASAAGAKEKVRVQTSPVFKELKPNTDYSFAVFNPSGTGICIQRTETETGARFGQIPGIVFEGEVFNVKPDSAIRRMLSTSGGSVTWSCESDCVKVTSEDTGHGCRMEIVDCEYNNNKLIECTLVADVTYAVKGKNGQASSKTKKFKEKFKIENEVDAMDIGEFLGTSENVYGGGLIKLTTLESVSFNIVLNQGEETDTASRQRLTYYISDAYGNKNPNGKKIAKVSGRGEIKGVNPGVTYVTIAPRHTYNRYEKAYDFMVTIPIVCQEVNEVYFDSDALENEDDNILIYQRDESFASGAAIPGTVEENKSESYVVKAYVKDKVDLKPYLRFNPDSVFNADEMKQVWVSSDKSVVSVNSKGQIKCKSPGYATITVTPTGGLKISAATGKRDVNSKLCSTSIIIKVCDYDVE